MYKKYFAIFLLSSFVSIPVFAQDAVFSNSETEQFNLQPLNYTTKPVVTAKENIPVVKSSALNAVQTSAPVNSDLSDQNFLNAINNLDNAQVEIREQLASYSALMAQAKTNYEAKKDEYNTYKKQYNALKKKMRSVERTKKLIQNNVNVSSVQN